MPDINDDLVASIINDVQSGIQGINIKPESDLEKYVKEYVKLLPEETKQILCDGGQVNEGKTKGELANSIARSITSFAQQSGNEYNENAHRSALENFEKLDKSKYNEVAQGKVDIIEGLASLIKSKKSELKINPSFNIGTTFATSATQNTDAHQVLVEKKDLAEGFASGIIAKVAGIKSPFKDQLIKSHGVLPANIVTSCIVAAISLANDPKYQNLSQDEATALGKSIGKKVRNELFTQKDTATLENLSTLIIDKADTAENSVKKFGDILPNKLKLKLNVSSTDGPAAPPLRSASLAVQHPTQNQK